MTASVPGAPFEVRDAIATIERATAYDAPLRRRTEGVTWIVWGLASAVVLLTISALMDLPGWQPPYAALAMWPLIGLAGISAVWRIAALSAPALGSDPRRVVRAALLAGAAAVALGTLAWYAYVWTGTYAVSSGIFAFLPWALANGAQWRRMTDAGRRIAIVAGIVMAIGGPLIASAWPMVPSALDILVLAGLLGGVPFAIGLYRALTG
ncbi:MAG TPA: hypothetical protein VM582_08710 [Candidatus Thermoplasmatota archaeon]|nr:hypothetical protein [Candidatus Thermoplasmatota archaeon]